MGAIVELQQRMDLLSRLMSSSNHFRLASEFKAWHTLFTANSNWYTDQMRFQVEMSFESKSISSKSNSKACIDISQLIEMALFLFLFLIACLLKYWVMPFKRRNEKHIFPFQSDYQQATKNQLTKIMLPNVVKNHDVDDRFPHMNKSPDDDAQSGDKSHFPIVVVC